MEREPAFEDDNIKVWRLDKSEEDIELGPTTLEIDGNSEPYESRVYGLSEAERLKLAVEAARERPDLPLEHLVDEFLGTEGSVRILAKRDRETGQLSYIMVGTWGDQRVLVERQADTTEALFRERVQLFEAGAVADGVFDAPQVIDLEAWRRYAAERRGPTS